LINSYPDPRLKIISISSKMGSLLQNLREDPVKNIYTSKNACPLVLYSQPELKVN